MGGAQGISLVLGMVRVKFIAILIGPLGIGLLGTYKVILNLIGTVAGLGIKASAVRDVAAAMNKGEEELVGRTVLTLRRVCFLSGSLGAIALAILAKHISSFTFDSDEYAKHIAILGIVVFLNNIKGGQTALIQGARRIGDLAKLNIIGAFAGTAISVGLYLWLGLAGIIPALTALAVVQLIACWYFARKIPIPNVEMSWSASIAAAGGMVRFGLVFMWNALLLAVVAFLTRAFITQQLDLAAVGIFSAAFALSGMFVQFILSAMGADFYPRLTAEANNPEKMCRLVNEQTEIGLLLSVPGLLATLALAPWIIQLFYTAEFLPAVALLQWFILGCLGRVIAWPMGFIMLAQGKSRWFFFTETLFNVAHLGLIWVGLILFGLEGVSMAFAALYVIYIFAVYGVSQFLIAYRWSRAVKKLLIILLPIVFTIFLVSRNLPIWPSSLIGVIASAVVGVMCLRGLVNRIGSDHRVVKMAIKIPGMQRICGA
jgi:O-antigen/teichoic acid export membrane protein